MEERIKTALEFLRDGQAFTVGDLRLSAERSEVLEVTGWSQYKNFSNLSKKQSLKELEEIKTLFYKMINVSGQLKDFSEDRKVVFNLCYDDYGKGSVLICSQTLERTKWSVDLK